MAIYHLHVKNISRGDGRSAVAAAAYRAGETLPNDAEEKASAFGGRRGVIHTEIRLPEGVPTWMGNRATLWNRAEAAERRKDARLAKEIEFALPWELGRERWVAAARAMADHYVRQGLVVDLAVHDDGTEHNPHVHMLLTTRVANENGFAGKLRTADGVAFVHEARALWAAIANAALTAAGASAAVDHRSYKAAGIAISPSTHRGPSHDERRRRRQEAQMAEAEAKPEVPQDEPASKNLGVPTRQGTAGDVLEEMPVPDAEGRPISPQEQDSAERAMLMEMERETVEPATEWWLEAGTKQTSQRSPLSEIDREQWWERDR